MSLKQKYRERVLKNATFEAFSYPYKWEELAEALTSFCTHWSDVYIDEPDASISITGWFGKIGETLKQLPDQTVINGNKTILREHPTWIEFYVSSFSKSLRDKGSLSGLMRVRQMKASGSDELLDFANINFAETILFRYHTQLPFKVTGWLTGTFHERYNAH